MCTEKQAVSSLENKSRYPKKGLAANLYSAESISMRKILKIEKLEKQKTKFTVADIISEVDIKKYPWYIQKVFNNIMDCRTTAMKGHANKCSSCSHIEFNYNSCGSRSCPTCCGRRQKKWAVKIAEERTVRIRHFGILGNTVRKDSVLKARLSSSDSWRTPTNILKKVYKLKKQLDDAIKENELRLSCCRICSSTMEYFLGDYGEVFEYSSA